MSAFGPDLVPSPAERRHHDRLDDAQDVGLAGVVGAELGPAAGIERALEEGAEDGRLDRGPIEPGGLGEGGELGRCELEGLDRAEEAAVDAGNLLVVDVAARFHGAQELGDGGQELLRVFGGEGEHVADQAAGQDGDVLGEETEEDLDQEVGGLVRILAAGLE